MSVTTAVPMAGHHEDADTVGRRWRMGVGFIIVADVMFVLSILFSYLYLRGLNTENSWVPKGSVTAPILAGLGLGCWTCRQRDRVPLG